MSDFKEFRVTGAALKMPGGGRRKGTRKNRKEGQEGGDNGGALMQLSAQSVPNMPSGADAAGVAQQLQDTVKTLMAGTFGPKGTALQAGGDNSGALVQLKDVPQMGGPMNTQAFQTAFRAQAAQALAQLGPDSAALQTGGKKQKGGDGISGTIQLSANRAPTLPGYPEPSAVISGINPEQPAPAQAGGKLVLAPPKRKTRIALKAKKHRGGSESAAGNLPPGPALTTGGAHTRKARKIHLRVKGVTSRLAKAKKARKTAMNAPLTEVRTRLEGAGVIKKGSKAPEPMLRNMYADLLITKKGL
jgi:hypothetical protein